jgi:hypothetical protein
MKRPNPSMTKAPLNSVAFPGGCWMVSQVASASTITASQPIASASRSVSGRNTPSISSAMAPTTSTISGASSQYAETS